MELCNNLFHRVEFKPEDNFKNLLLKFQKCKGRPKIAQKTPNVRRVYDEVAVSMPISISQQSKDMIITGEVRSKILTKKGLESGSIRIVTENGVVYLMGIVTAAQGNLAVEVARQVSGVQKVVKVFQYIT